MRKHAAANDAIRSVGTIDREVIRLATKAWQDGLKIGEKNGWRNAQASVLAPTGCLDGDTSSRPTAGCPAVGARRRVRRRWQDLDVQVSTDEGARDATKFFVNGEEPTRRIVTEGGYRIQGTLAHRIKVVDPQTGPVGVEAARRHRRPATWCRCSSARWSASLGGCRCRCSTRPTTPATATSVRARRCRRRARRAGRLLHGRRKPARQGDPALRRRHRPRRR